jgi:L-alanine-DL-glutamate epimerase-like enolase superfamily enzyme
LERVIGAMRDEDVIEKVLIEPCVQRQQDPTWQFARGSIPNIQGWVVTLVSRGGVQGWGHVLATPVAGPDVQRTLTALEASVAVVQGRNAMGIEAIHHAVQEVNNGLPCVLSGITSALYELVARSLKVPLHVLFGGAVRSEIPASRLIPIKPPELMAEEATRLFAEGYRILKLKLNGDAVTDIERVRSVRKAVGTGMQLTVDANQAYDADTAIDVCEVLAAEGVALMEQPVPAADRDGLRKVTRAKLLPIEADEAIGSIAGLMELISMGAADSYNLKVPYMGGLRNTLIAARLCEAAGVQCRLGAIFGPRVASAQAAQLVGVLRSVSGGAEIAESEHLLDDPFQGFDAHAGLVTVMHTVGSGVQRRQK